MDMDHVTWDITGEFEMSLRCESDAVATGNRGYVDCYFEMGEAACKGERKGICARISFQSPLGSPEHLQELAARLKKGKRVRVIAQHIETNKIRLTHVAFDDGMRYRLTASP